jgi:O-antigen chain-terminating methyltransferase
VPEWARFGGVKRKIAQQVARVVLYLSDFIINQQKQVNGTILSALRAIGDSLGRLESRLGEQVQQKDEVAKSLNILQGAVGRVDQEQQATLQRLETELARREEHIQGVEQEQQAAVQRLETELARREERENNLEKSLYLLKVNLVQQERRLTLLLEEARKRLPEPFDQQQLQTFVTEEQHRLDALYVSFEDQFRGTREDIKERLRVYLPLLKENGIGTEQMPIVDVGCGRGEWLELLREEGLLAQGVDINRVLIEQCRQQDFKITESDVLAYLRKLPDRSVGAVTGFHIIEHLSLQNLIHLLDETVRVLAPDGVAIFETPNPQNVTVGSCNFYLDPTHQRPLPSATIKFLAEARGLCRVEVLNLHPYPAALKVDGADLAERFNEFFYGPQDYAVVGWKA